jgi:hypothetical protein
MTSPTPGRKRGDHPWRAHYDKLKPGGLFIIEDCTPDTLSRFNLVFSKFASMWGQPQGMRIVSIPHSSNIFDNSLIIIQK